MDTSIKVRKWCNKPTAIKTSTIVIQKIKNYYQKQGINDTTVLPHYTRWNQKHYGVKTPILRPLTDSWADRKYVEHIKKQCEKYQSFDYSKYKNPSPEELKISSQKTYDTYKTNSQIIRKGYALTQYTEAFERLQMGNKFENYCNFISSIIGESWEYLLYDAIIDTKCSLKRKKNGEIKLHYSDYDIRYAENNQVCEWFGVTEYAFYDISSSISEEKSFIDFAQRKLNEINLPYDFNMRIENNLLIFEKTYFEIQRELLYNPKLRNLFKPHTYKGMKSEGLSMYKFQNFCERIISIFTDSIVEDYQTLEEYIYIIEKLTGINLVVCFTKYYAEISKKAKETMTESKINDLLFGILEELLEFPNVFSRIDIVKEYLEPVLFWEGNLEKKLECVGRDLELLKRDYKKNWNIVKEAIEEAEIALDTSVENLNFEIRNEIKKCNTKNYPFVFVDATNVQQYADNVFAIICKYAIEYKL